MYLIVGLGNPGSDYAGTRHNLGFDVADKVAQALKLDFREGKGDYLIAVGSFRDKKLGLVKPLTYMNNSGSAVADVVERFEAHLTEILIVCDDFQLPLGVLRVRPRGTDGGHNGLYSIIYQLRSDEFPRLRCGIGSEKMPKNKTLRKEFVLEGFADDELPEVRRMTDRAKDACLSFVDRGVKQTMNAFNQKPKDVTESNIQ